MFRYLQLLIITFFSLSGVSQQNMIGEKAPEIKVEKWIYPKILVDDWTVTAVPEKLNGKAIILDIWFTTCAPCVASIPKLNKLVKQFPEITFISLTFENDSIIEEFLDRMILYYPIGSYPQNKLIEDFGICGYPTTFFIDENGIIKWVGSPFDLNKDMLKSFMGDKTINSVRVDKSNLENPELNMAYDFMIKKHDIKMNSASYTHTYPYDITIFNRSLISILESYYQINKSRIIYSDTGFLNVKYDISLKADPELTTQSNCRPMLKYLIEENLNFSISKSEIDTIVYNIEVVNDTLLSAYKSQQVGYGSWVRDDYTDLKGASLHQLQDFLENTFNVLVLYSDNILEGVKFDFAIPTDSFKNAKEDLLNKYGILMTKERNSTEFWEVDIVD